MAKPEDQVITTRGDVTVELVKSSAADSDVVWAAKVSTVGDQSLEDVDADPEKSKGLINFLMRDRHGTPFEHNSMTFFVSAPIFVFREFHRHRIGFSYNEESGRYKQLGAVLYVPAEDRKLVQIGKAGAYDYIDGTPEQFATVQEETDKAYRQAYASYQTMLDAGVAREVARIVLPVGLFSSMYVTCNARSLMSFLCLRTKHADSKFPSFPQREIEMVAEKMEAEWAQLMPLTYEAFQKNGRVSP